MTNNQLVGLTGLAVVVVGGAAWILLPALQSPQRIVDTRAQEAAERARRILRGFSAEAAAAAAVAERSGMVGDLSAERINRVVEEDSHAAQENLKAAEAGLKNVLDDVRTRGRALDQRFADLDAGAALPTRPELRFGSNAAAMSQSMSEGLRARSDLMGDNAARLSQALEAAQASVAEAKGEASGADNLHAQRMLGGVLIGEALAAKRRASVSRLNATHILQELAAAGRRIAAYSGETRIVRTSGVESVIERAAADGAERQEDLSAMLADVSALQAKIDSLRQRIAQQHATSDAARARMEALESRGLRYEDPRAVESFREEYERDAATYRAAVREAHTLENGTLANARIDDSGDYIDGAFVADPPGARVEHQPGLDEYERELRSLEIQRGPMAETVKDAENTNARLAALAAEYRARAAQASTEIEASSSAIEEGFARYRVFADEVAAAEDEALRKFRQAASAFGRASQIATARANDTPTLSPTADELSHYKLIREDRWLPAELDCQAADAQVWQAFVLYDRFSHGKRALATLDAVTQVVPLPDYDSAALREHNAESKTEAEELLDKAIRSLERASGGLDRHWTVAASVAGAYYALALFDRPELEAVARANYAAVIENREDDPYVRPFVERLNQLRER